MSEEKMNGMIENITTSSGKTIEVNPELIMEAIDDVTNMLDGHVVIIKSVKSIIKRGIAKGMKPSEASQIALELQRRAAAKANSLVDFEDEVKPKTSDEELKKDIFKACHIHFDTKEEAEKAKGGIQKRFEEDNFVTAPYAYSFTGKYFAASDLITKYGWEKLPEMRIVEENGKYILELPEPVKLSEDKEVKAATDEG